MTLTAFLMGVISQAILISSILYAIYLLYETGEIIKRDRERIQKAIDQDINMQIAYIRDKNDMDG